tara:strand:+ start:657 stop:1256 length:600 start_codon:yes stop_codon:yes gene_type:complete
MNRQLKGYDIPFERFNAVRPSISDLEPGGKYYEFLSRSVPRLRLNINNKEHIDHIIGTMGCYISHYQIHKIAAEQNFEHYVILEDDCMLRKNWIETLNEFTQDVNEPYDIIRSYKNGSMFKFINCNYQSKFVDKFSHNIDDGSHAILCNGSSALKIVDYMNEDYVYNIDAVYNTHRINVFAIHYAKQKPKYGSDIPRPY